MTHPTLSRVLEALKETTSALYANYHTGDHAGCGYCEAYNKGEQAIADLEAMGSGWRPIETAPRDGTFVIVYAETGTVHIAQLQMEYTQAPGQPVGDTLRWRERAGFYNITATHWQPLPLPPSTNTGESLAEMHFPDEIQHQPIVPPRDK